MNEEVRAALAALVQSEGDAFYGDAARVEAQLGERVGDHPSEIAALVTAVRAGVVTELLDVKPGLREIAVGHLAGRMVRIFGADPDAAHWAVESWAQALGAAQPAPAPAPAPPPPVPAVDNPPTGRYPPPERKGRFSIPWPWVAFGGAAVLGLIALVVLVKLITGLTGSDSGGGGEAPSPSTTIASRSTTPTTQAAPLTVPPGLNLGTGDVQITLVWADGNDLDLHVIDPSGTEIYFSNPKSPTGGTLDHDDTAGCATTGTHVENVFWPTGGAPPGRYRVFVKNYSSCGAPSRYSLNATAKTNVAISSSGTVGAHEGDQTPVSEFSVS
ncbi:MAG: hypothetical protein JOZ68_11045 [Acidimicrobiia bacterium]|nr:hypothetical protein [Acidimicrobiia bacterium]